MGVTLHVPGRIAQVRKTIDNKFNEVLESTHLNRERVDAWIITYVQVLEAHERAYRERDSTETVVADA